MHIWPYTHATLQIQTDNKMLQLIMLTSLAAIIYGCALKPQELTNHSFKHFILKFELHQQCPKIH